MRKHKQLIEEADKRWAKDKAENGWTGPDPKGRLWRLPAIRHCRWFFLADRVYSRAEKFAKYGIGFGGPNQYDLWILYGIYRGWF